MIESTIKMTVPAEKRNEVLQTVKAMLGPIQYDPTMAPIVKRTRHSGAGQEPAGNTAETKEDQ